MRTLVSIVLIIVLFFVYQYYQIRQSIKINFALTNLSGQGFDFSSFVSNGTVIKARIKFNVFFRSLLSFSVSNLDLKVYRNGLLLGQSTPGNLENKIRLNFYPDVINTIYQNFDLHLNTETISLFALIQAKKPYSLNYKMSFKILGLTLTKTGIYESK